MLEPQDVSGWSISNVWTLARISNAHTFLDLIVKHKLLGALQDSWFEDIDTFKREMATFRMPATVNTTSNEEVFKYSFAAVMCPAQAYFDVSEQMMMTDWQIDAAYLFGAGNFADAAARKTYFQTAQSSNVVENVCAFTC